MFKKVKYENGKREIYIGNFRVLKYFKQSQYLEYQISEAVSHKLFFIKTKGIDYFKNLLKRAFVAEKY